MSVDAEIYDQLAAIDGIGGVFDTKLPDDYDLQPGIAVLVFQLISDVPFSQDIAGPILTRESRWQVSIYAHDILTARAAKELVISTLHDYRGQSIRRCDFDGAPGEIFEADNVPPSYHVPIEFAVLQ